MASPAQHAANAASAPAAPNAPAVQSFNNIALLSRGRAPPGVLRIALNNASAVNAQQNLSSKGIAWKSAASGAAHAISFQEMKKAVWVRSGRATFTLEIVLKGSGNTTSTVRKSDHVDGDNSVDADGDSDSADVGGVVRFEGFRAEDRQSVAGALESYAAATNGQHKIPLSDREVNGTGWNWGKAKITTAGSSSSSSTKKAKRRQKKAQTVAGQLDDVVSSEDEDEDVSSDDGINGEGSLDGEPVLSFVIADQPAFEIPLGEVSNAVMQTAPLSRNDVTLHFHGADDAANPASVSAAPGDGVTMCELRLFVPNRNAPQGGEAASALPSTAKEFHSRVLALADIGGAADKAMATLPELQLMAPRGRYDMQLYAKSMKIHGKTYSFTVRYDNVARLYQLPQPDQQHVFVVISLDQPLRKDRQQYQHLVFRFARDEEMRVAFDLDADLRKRFPDLQEKMRGESYATVCKVVSLLTKRKVTTPGSFEAASTSGRATARSGGNAAAAVSMMDKAVAVKCSVGSNDGYLYPLEGSFFFLHKPAILIRHSQIKQIEFGRYAGAGAMDARTFDLIVEMSDDKGTVHTFTQIGRAEYQNLFNFVRSKKLRIKNLEQLQSQQVVGGARQRVAAMADFGEFDSDSDGGFAAPSAAAAGGAQSVLDMFGGESESEDDDFSAGESSEDSLEEGSGSVDDEGNVKSRSKKSSSSSASASSKKRKHSSSSKEGKKSKKSKKGKKSKKSKKHHRSEDGAGAGADAAPSNEE